jgi:hypothetical protein
MREGFSVLIVEGLTEDGQRFRPSDWVERLIDTVSVYGQDRRRAQTRLNGHERRQQQLAFLHAQVIEGRKCLVVDGRLSAANPQAYAYLVDFIRSNRLRCYCPD